MSKKVDQTKRKGKRRLNIKRTFLLVVVIFLIFFALSKLTKVDIENIEIIGNVYVSDSQIIKLAELNKNIPYLRFNSKEICQKIKEYPLISDCHIIRNLNFKVKIELTENKPILYYLNNSKLILSDMREADIQNTFGVPTLINYVPDKILKTFVTGLAQIDSDIICSISEIEYAPSSSSDGTYIDEERFMLSMNDGNIVYINNRNIEVLAMYGKIYSSIGDKKGYYNFDSDFNNYFFKEFASEKPNLEVPEENTEENE